MVRIKICGVTTPADAVLAAQLGADAIGLNFYEPSPRHVTIQQAGEILRVIPPRLQPIGVFVDEPLGFVRWTAVMAGGIETVQIHGDHTEILPPRDPCIHPAIRQVVHDHVLTTIAAFAIQDAVGLSRIASYVTRQRSQYGHASPILVDAHVPGMYGGTGQTAPWQLLAGFDPGVPLILAGGLTPDNVAEAIRIVRPYAVNVASGVESVPGRKDPEKMRRFIENARAV